MARKYLDPQMAPQYRSPHVQSDYNRYQQPPAQKINGLPSNKVIAPGTGPGTGRTTLGIGWQNRDGSFSPLSPMGSPTGSLSQPMPTMKKKSGAAALAERGDNFARSVAEGRAADEINTYNRLNPDKHMDAGGNIVPKVNSTGYDVPLNGSGGYLDSRTAPPAPSAPANTAGQAESMRAAAGITGPSSSARGEWQQGQPGTNKIVSNYGKGSSSIGPNPSQVATNAANAAGSASGGLYGKFMAGAKATMDSMPKNGSAKFDGQSRSQFFSDAANRQNTGNAFAKSPSAGTSPSSQIATPTPSKLNHSPADLAKAKEWVSKVEASKASTTPGLADKRQAPAAIPSPAPASTAPTTAATSTPSGEQNQPVPAASTAATPSAEPSEFDKSPTLAMAKGIGTLGKAAFDAFRQVGEKAAEHLDKSFINTAENGNRPMPPAASVVPTTATKTTTVGNSAAGMPSATPSGPSLPMSTTPGDWRSSARQATDSPFAPRQSPTPTIPAAPQSPAGFEPIRPMGANNPFTAAAASGASAEPKLKEEDTAAE